MEGEGRQNDDDKFDDDADQEIWRCLAQEPPRSFFLFAGAGSGKTSSLVKALDRLLKERRRRLELHGKSVGVITYTNAACDEVKQRLEFDLLIDVRTIHSFCWELIGSYPSDIREWLRRHLAKEIARLEADQAKGRSGSKAEVSRAKELEAKRRRIHGLTAVKRFTYNPNGENRGRDALSHSEVIGIASDLLKGKVTLQQILVGRFPILLVDESQDTIRDLMGALIGVQISHQSRFCLGLFGDSMQRIYGHGVANLEQCIPADWSRPIKRMNHRCPGRVIELLNRLRADQDGIEQKGRADKSPGFVRLFVLPAMTGRNSHAEEWIAGRMAEITADAEWSKKEGCKTLTLEHHMAARRLGFSSMFESLYAVDSLKTGLLDGTLPVLRFLTKDVSCLVHALRRGDRFAAATIARKRSPLLDARRLASMGQNQVDSLQKARAGADKLQRLWDRGRVPTFFDVLSSVSESGLFDLPDVLESVLAEGAPSNGKADLFDKDDSRGEELDAWRKVMAMPFEQVEHYDRYIDGHSQFDTHQGVKGLEFPRVMVVIDDEEARGFMFSYEKLFGVKGKTDTDKKNERDGKETSIDKTRRLFYVTCSRAERSLALVVYSCNPAGVKEHVVAERWFAEDEVELPGIAEVQPMNGALPMQTYPSVASSLGYA